MTNKIIKAYCKIKDNKAFSIANGDDKDFFKSIGLTLNELEQSDVDGCYYLKGYAPMKSEQQKKKEANEKRISEIDLELTDVDSKSTRSLRDFALNFGKIGKEAILKEAIGYLVKYNDRALQLREERAKLLEEVSLL